MKKKTFLMFMASLFCTGQAIASNVLTVSGAEVPVGGQATIEIGCSLDKEFTAFELQLSLPEGLSLATDDTGKLIVECGFAGSHVVEGNLLRSNGKYKIVCYSGKKESFPTSGILFRAIVKADEELMPDTTLAARIEACEFVRTVDSAGEELDGKDIPVPVHDIHATPPDDATVYDLSGRHIVRMGKGIFIVGSKKVMK